MRKFTHLLRRPTLNLCANTLCARPARKPHRRRPALLEPLESRLALDAALPALLASSETANQPPALWRDATRPTLSTGLKNEPLTFRLFASDAENDPFVFDAARPSDENIPYGIQIDNRTGGVTVTPPLDFVGTFDIDVFVRDQANSDQSNADRLQIVIEESTRPQLDLILTLTRPDGSRLTSLAPGEEFILKVAVRDLSPNPQGVFAAYLDITWDSTLAVATGLLLHADGYSNGKSGDLSTPGRLDEGGAFSSSTSPGRGPSPLFTIPMRALGQGNLQFKSNPADIFPHHQALLLGYTPTGQTEEPVPSAIRYGSAAITVGGLGALEDNFDGIQNGGPITLDVLANDALSPTTGGTFTITSVGPGSHGGIIAIAPDGSRLIYTPAPGFVGNEQFDYTIADGLGGIVTGRVTVHVEVGGNTPPLATNDTAHIFADADNVIPVLANDSTAPDIGETLSILAVGQPDQGGTVSIVGGNIIYRPRDAFILGETFTYTIGDGRGATATATVRTVTIQRPSTDPPAAAIADDNAPTISDAITATTTKQAFALQLDRPAGITVEDNTLHITGSAESDKLTVSLRRNQLHISGTIGQTKINRTIPTTGLQQIAAQLNDGNDSLIVRSNIRIALSADGGAGNDSLTAGGASAILLGGDGNDRLTGGSRSDLLIGGEGLDTLKGSSRHDLSIQGSTDHDQNAAALAAILAEWSSKSFSRSRTSFRGSALGTH